MVARMGRACSATQAWVLDGAALGLGARRRAWEEAGTSTEEGW